MAKFPELMNEIAQLKNDTIKLTKSQEMMIKYII